MEEVKLAPYVIRAVDGYCIILVEGYYLVYYISLLNRQSFRGILIIILGIFLALIILQIVLACVAIRNPGEKRHIGNFFLTFKAFYIFMTIIFDIIVIVAWNNIEKDFKKYEFLYVLVASLAEDTTFDPIELILNCCCHVCRGSRCSRNGTNANVPRSNGNGNTGRDGHDIQLKDLGPNDKSIQCNMEDGGEGNNSHAAIPDRDENKEEGGFINEAMETILDIMDDDGDDDDDDDGDE